MFYVKSLSKTALFWTAVVIEWEFVFHMVIWRSLSAKLLYAVPFILSLAVFFALVTRAWPWKGANRGFTYGIICVFAFIFSVQTVYYKIFSTLLSFSLVGMGGDAITHFFDMAVDGTVRSLPFILLYFLPAAVFPVLERHELLDSHGVGMERCILTACVSILLFALGVPPLGSDSPRGELYYELNISIDGQAEAFGLITSERLELQRMGSNETGLVTDVLDITSDKDKTDGQPEEPEAPAANVLEEMDFAKLLAAADTPELQKLTQYFSTRGGTKKNEYTGLFEGFNVIEICAESFFAYAVDPVRTPVLYRLTHEGIVFDNFYCSFPNTTTNGEFSLCMGLMPDKNRRSFTLSISDYLPFTLARLMKAQGVTPRAYHDNTAYFYGRINSHTNMGYTFKALDYGLELSPNRPYSDLEMMEKTVDDYIGEDRFLAYYMTYSGHAPYNPDDNTIARKNQNAISDPNASVGVRSYLAGQLELEYALEYLMDRLEQAGILDKTLIVLTGDHFPYALSTEEMAYLAGEETVASDPFWQYKNNFVCWSAALEEPVHVDSLCCTQDILPTVLNLLGLPYDSRLLTGTDALSDSTHIAVLFDGSFRTRDLLYNAKTGAVTYFTDRSLLPEGYAGALKTAVNNQFSVSASILRNDYYGFAYRTLGLADTSLNDSGKYTLKDLEGKWYADETESLIREGVVSGHTAGFFGDDIATRAELCSMLVKALDIPVPQDPEGVPFVDIVPGDWIYEVTTALWAAGVLEGDTDRFQPYQQADWDFARRLAEGIALYENSALDVGAVVDGVREDANAQEDAGAQNGTLTRGAAAVLTVRLRDALLESENLPDEGSWSE